jgi:hypothetical protein
LTKTVDVPLVPSTGGRGSEDQHPDEHAADKLMRINGRSPGMFDCPHRFQA